MPQKPFVKLTIPFSVPRRYSGFQHWEFPYQAPHGYALLRSPGVIDKHDCLIGQSIDLRNIQLLLGHGDLRATMIYIHLSKSHVGGHCQPAGRAAARHEIDLSHSVFYEGGRRRRAGACPITHLD
ncbi:MAG TPA: hypothetical protein VKB88_37545 [Bryobacteraceae bacterium]|nr:hypothetical protein [Bryobacteraceae bacterium]